MSTEENGVKEFFNRTGLYLHKRFGIMLRRAIIKQLIPSVTYSTVLDVGCGDGTLALDFIEGAQSVSMIDLSENMLSLAKANIEFNCPTAKDKVKYYNGDFTSFESDKQFDLILIVGVLAHVPDLEEVFAKLQGLLKPEGVIVTQYSDSGNMLIKMRRWLHRTNSQYALNQINQKVIEDLCRKNHFSIADQKRFNFPFFGMKYISDRALYRFQHWLLSKRGLSFLLSDVILVLKKNG